MVKNLKLLIVAVISFVSVQAQDSTKAVVVPAKVDSDSPFTGYYFFRFTGSVLSLQLCESKKFD